MKGGPQIKIVSKKYACSFSGGQLKGSLRKMPQVQVDMLVAGGWWIHVLILKCYKQALLANAAGYTPALLPAAEGPM